MIAFFRIIFVFYYCVLVTMLLGVLVLFSGFIHYAFSSGSQGLSIDYGSGVVDGGSGDLSYTLPTGNTIDTPTTGIVFDTGSSSISDISGGINNPPDPIEFTTGVSVSGSIFHYGDLQIIEVFPSSGGCLDEHIIIQSFRDYSGWITLGGLGTSTGSISIYVDLQSGSNLIVTDSMAGMIPSHQTILVPSITLTNGGERLQIIISGMIIDDIVYSNLQSIHSLFFTLLSGTQRLFTTNATPTTSTTCNTGPSMIGSIPGGVGLCDISLSTLQYQSTGSYRITATVSGSMVSSCQTDGHIDGGGWSINTSSRDVGQCQTSFIAQLGINTLIFYLISGGQTLCYDQFIFANNYDVYIVKQQTTAPGGSCQTGKPINTFIYPSTDCGIYIQGTYPLGLFITNSFNFIVSYKDILLSDSQSTYQCSIDFGNGTIIQECNPSAYRFTKPGIHKLSLSIYNSSDHQTICTTRTSINVPINKLGVNLLERKGELFTGFDSENSGFITGTILPTHSYEDNITGSDSNALCQTGDISLPFFLHSLLPNPVGSDAVGEEIVFEMNTGYTLSSLSLSNYYLLIGKKKHTLSGLLIDQRVHQKQGRGLNNKGGCVTLSHRYCPQLQRFCYDKVQEGQWIEFNNSEKSLLSGVWTQTGTIRDEYNTEGVLSDKSSKLSKKLSNATGHNLSCNEKISQAKAKQKISFDKKYTKLKRSYQLYKQKTKEQVDELKIKELLARNKRYLYKNVWNTITKNIVTSRGSIADTLGVSWYIKKVNFLELQINSGYIYTNKLRTNNHTSYTYTNDISKYIKKQKNSYLINTLFPDSIDYIDHLRAYQMNYLLIEKLKKINSKKNTTKNNQIIK